MKASRCLICDNETYALSARWDRYFAYINGFESINTMLRYCPVCRFAFVQDRDDSFFNKYYAFTYGSEEGKKRRLDFDPIVADYWLDVWPEDIVFAYNSERAERVRNTLEKFNIAPKNILDFGGGDGKYSNLIFGDDVRKKVVDPVIGVSSFEDKYDFILLSHVLEHMSNPLSIIKELRNFLTDDGVIWIEVPVESKKFTNMEQHHKLPNEIIVSEHISFFSETSLKSIASKLDFNDSVWFEQYVLREDGIANKLVDFFRNLTCQTLVLSNSALSLQSEINNDTLFGISYSRVKKSN